MSAFRNQQNIYIPADHVLTELRELQNAVPENEVDSSLWWRPMITMKFSDNGTDVRRIKNPQIQVAYSTILLTIDDHVRIPFRISTGKNNETCLGKIGLPEDSEEFRKLVEVNPKAKARLNKMKPTFNISEYADKNNTLNSSNLYKLIELVLQIIEKEITNYLENGTTYLDFLKKARASSKTARIADIIKAYDLEYPSIRLGGQILLSDDCKSVLKKSVPDSADIATAFDKLFIISSTKIGKCVQSHIPDTAETNAGAELSNPYVRCLIECNQITGLPKISILDYAKGRETKTNVPILVNGQAINVNNIHEAIPYGTELRGNFSFDEFCFNKMNISILLKAQELVIMPSNNAQIVTKSSWYDSDEEEVVIAVNVNDVVAVNANDVAASNDASANDDAASSDEEDLF